MHIEKQTKNNQRPRYPTKSRARTFLGNQTKNQKNSSVPLSTTEKQVSSEPEHPTNQNGSKMAKIRSQIAWNGWPGSESTKILSWETKIASRASYGKTLNSRTSTCFQPLFEINLVHGLWILRGEFKWLWGEEEGRSLKQRC